MIKFIKSLFRKKTELERYLILIELVNEYYSRNRVAILRQCGRKNGAIKPLKKPDSFIEGSNPFLFLGRGSKMEN
jgi:hypothetical protein